MPYLPSLNVENTFGVSSCIERTMIERLLQTDRLQLPAFELDMGLYIKRKEVIHVRKREPFYKDRKNSQHSICYN